MQDILVLFADKMVQNLMSLADSNKENEKYLVKVTLTTFHTFLLHQISCRHMSKVPLVKQLATSHLS